MTRTEPLILHFGRSNAAAYTVAEYQDSLYRAFIDSRADFIVLDSFMTGQKFRAAAVAWAVDNGLLYCSDIEDEGQSEIYAFRLTEAGRRWLTRS